MGVIRIVKVGNCITSFRNLSAIAEAGLASIMVILLVMIFISSITVNDLSYLPLGYSEAYSIADDSIEDDVALVSITTRYEQDLSIFHIFGEVMNNNLVDAVTNITLTATFYDHSGNELGSVNGSSFLNSLRPGEQSAFDIAVYGNLANKVKDFSYYKISKSWEAANNTKPDLLKLNINNIAIDRCGYYHIEGNIGNLGPESTNGIIVSAAFYNERGQVITSAFTMPVENELKPTRFAPYEFVIQNQSLSHFAYYSLNAQSINYTTADFSKSKSPNGAFGSNANLTVFTYSTLYGSDADQIEVYGLISDPDGPRSKEPIVSLSILSASGSELYTGTATLIRDSYFSRTFKLEHTSDGSDNKQVYRVRAQYQETTAENTFAVENKNSHSGVESADLNKCNNNSGLSMQELIIRPVPELDENDKGIGNDYDIHKSIIETKVNSPVIVTSAIANGISKAQPVVTILQVSDSSGVVVFLDAHESTTVPNNIYHVNVRWTPEDAGMYQIKSFSLSDLEEPRLLSSVIKTSVNVTY